MVWSALACHRFHCDPNVDSTMRPRPALLLPLLALLSCQEPKLVPESTAGEETPAAVEPADGPPGPGDEVIQRLNKIVIPVIDFEDLSLGEAIGYLRVRSIELDPYPDPEMRGVSILIQHPKGNREEADLGIPVPPTLPRFFAQRTTLPDALALSCELAGAEAYLTSVGLVACVRGASPFPNPRSREGEVWSRLVPGGPDPSLSRQLDHIVIPRIDFDDCSIDEAVDYYRLLAAELDPQQAGVQFVTMHPSPDRGTAVNAEGPLEAWIGEGPTIPRYQDDDVPLRRAIQHLCELTGYKAYLASTGVVLCGPGVVPFKDAEGNPPASWLLLSDAP